MHSYSLKMSATNENTSPDILKESMRTSGMANDRILGTVESVQHQA